jgi:hypothetical protein
MLRRLLRAAFMAIWIVPEGQIRVLSLTYQEHLFRLFHERRLNRFSHYIGIPMALSTMYAALPVSWAAAVALAIALLHSAIAIRNRLWMMCAVAAAAQGMLVTFGACILSPFYATPSSLWFSPWLHIIGWSFLQYSTHWLEPRIPEPWGTKPMMPKREWLRERGFRHLFLAAVALPSHVLVEWVSSPRNLFLILLRLVHWCGYRSAVLQKMDEDLARLESAGPAVLRYDQFNAELARVESVP